MIEQFFWLSVQRRDGCWFWVSSSTVTIHRTDAKFTDVPHRVAYRLKHGEIPHDKVVRHICANHRCVNPDHLVLGTVADNVRDMHNHGTASNAKLSTEHVFQIRERRRMGASFRELAEDYGVTVDTIRKIVRHQTRREG